MAVIFRCDISRLQAPQVARTYPPPMPAVGINADAFFIPANHSPLDLVTVIGLKPDSLPDAELDHGHLGAQLTDHSNPLYNLPIQRQQFIFSQTIQTCFVDHGESADGTGLPSCDGQEFVDAGIGPDGNTFQRVLQPGIRINAVGLGGANQRLDNGRAFPRSLGP